MDTYSSKVWESEYEFVGDTFATNGMSSTELGQCRDEVVEAPKLASLFSSSGEAKKTRIDERNAWEHPGFNRGVNLISDRMMTLPASVMKRFGNYYVPDCGHDLNPLVHFTACGVEDGDTMSAGWWRKTMTTWAIVWGNGVSAINRDRFGRATELIPLPPDRTYLVFENLREPLQLANGRIKKTQKWYCCYVGGNIVKFRPENVFHVRNMVTGNQHWSPGVIAYADKCLGVGVAATKFGGNFFDNGANGSGILMTPGHLEFESEEEKREFREKWERAYTGLSNASKTLILEEGFKYIQTTFDNNASQFLETRKFSNSEAAHFLRLHVAVLGGDAPYGYNTPEQARLDVRENAIEFWLSQFEDEYRLKLLSADEQQHGEYKIGFDRDYGVALPFTEKVDGYSSLWRDNIVPRAVVKNVLGLPISEEDNIYFDGSTSGSGVCEHSSSPPTLDPDVAEAARLNLTDAVWRGMRRVVGELKVAASDQKKIFAFFDRRESIEINFRSAIRLSCNVVDPCWGCSSEELITSKWFVPLIANVEQVINSATVETYEESLFETLINSCTKDLAQTITNEILGEVTHETK